MNPNGKFGIPAHYNDNKLVLMVRDPWTIYAYWEIKKDVEEKITREINSKNLTIFRKLLRVYDVTGTDHEILRPIGAQDEWLGKSFQTTHLNIAFDFELNAWVTSWYIHASDPGREWMADIGILSSDNNFFILARSNVVQTPLHRMSDEKDERRAFPGKEMEEDLKRRLASGIPSSGMFSSHPFRSKE